MLGETSGPILNLLALPSFCASAAEARFCSVIMLSMKGPRVLVGRVDARRALGPRAPRSVRRCWADRRRVEGDGLVRGVRALEHEDPMNSTVDWRQRTCSCAARAAASSASSCRSTAGRVRRGWGFGTERGTTGVGGGAPRGVESGGAKLTRSVVAGGSTARPLPDVMRATRASPGWRASRDGISKGGDRDRSCDAHPAVLRGRPWRSSSPPLFWRSVARVSCGTREKNDRGLPETRPSA